MALKIETHINYTEDAEKEQSDKGRELDPANLPLLYVMC